MRIVKLADTKKKDHSIEDKAFFLKNIRIFLMNDDIANEICNEFGYDKDIILGVPLSFSDDIDVAAKTLNGEMMINENLIDEKQEILFRYIIHELVHVFQHMQNKSERDPYPNKDYLDRPDEIEAFQFQIEFDEETRGENDAVEYVEELVDYHEVPESKQDAKEDELMKKVD